MPNVQCPGCGTIVAVDPAAGQIMGCPNCRTPLGAAGAPTAQSAPQGRIGEMPIASPPPPGSPSPSPRAGEMPVAPPPSPQPPAGTGVSPGLTPSPNVPSAPDQIAVQAAVQAAAQAAATQAVAAHVAAQSAAQATPRQAAPLATPVVQAAPAAIAVPQPGTQVRATRRVVRRKSTSGVFTVLMVAGLGFAAVGGALIWYLNGASKTRVTSPPAESTTPAPANSEQPAADKKTVVPAAAAKIRVQVTSIEFDAPRVTDAAGVAKVFENKCLVVHLKITNNGDAPAKYKSWHLRPYTAVGGNSPGETKLVDDRSRVYSAATLPDDTTFKGHTPKGSLPAGESIVDALLFRVPAGFSPRNIKSLRLTLSGKAVGQESGFQLKIDGRKIVEL